MREIRFGIFLIMSSTLCAFVSTEAGTRKWDPWLELQVKSGDDRTLGGVAALVPTRQRDSSLLFFDVRAMTDDDENHEGSLGLGYRSMLKSKWIIGGYGFVDYRRTLHDNNFLQGTFGVEALSEVWDFRLNAYLPEDDEPVDSLTTAAMSGSRIVVHQGMEIALRGTNAEFGWKVPTEAVELRLYGGGYWYDSPDELEDVSGPRARAEVRFNDVGWLGEGSRVSVGVEAQSDDLRDDQVFGYVNLRFGLGGKASRDRVSGLSALERRMVERIERDVDVVTAAGTFGAPETARDAQTGQLLDNVVVFDGSTTLTETVAQAGPDGLIVVPGTQGVGPGDNAVLQPGQTLLGGQGTLPVEGSRSGARASFTAPGEPGGLAMIRPTLTLADDTRLIGLRITDGGLEGAGLAGTDLSNVVLRDNDLSLELSLHGASADDLTLIGNTLGRGSGGAGQSLSNALLVDNDFNVTISLDNVTVMDSRIDLSGFHGDNMTLAGNVISNGLTMTGSNLTLTDNTITGDLGLRFGAVSELTLTGNTFTDVASDAAIFFFPATNVIFDDNVFSGTIDGVLANLNGGTFSGSGNVDSTTSSAGICNDNAADYTGSTGFSFINGEVCGAP